MNIIIFRFGIYPLTELEKMSDLQIEFNHTFVYVAGRYNKYSRMLSQTPWIIEGIRKTESSVEELIAEKIVEIYHASGKKNNKKFTNKKNLN